jgi:hypothetical protein
MKKYIFALIVAFSSFMTVKGEDGSYDVFVPISKYIEMGDSEKLSAWFSDNLEVTIFSNSNNHLLNYNNTYIKLFLKTEKDIVY